MTKETWGGQRKGAGQHKEDSMRVTIIREPKVHPHVLGRSWGETVLLYQDAGIFTLWHEVGHIIGRHLTRGEFGEEARRTRPLKFKETSHEHTASEVFAESFAAWASSKKGTLPNWEKTKYYDFDWFDKYIGIDFLNSIEFQEQNEGV